VQVAPALGLRIRQIAFRGKALLHVPDDPEEAGWPNLGGAGERMHPSWTYGRIAGEPSDTVVSMETDAISGSSIKHQAAKRVELSGDGCIRIGIASRRISRLPADERTRCAAVTEYVIGQSSAGFRVETRARDGAWTPVSLSATNVPPPKTKAKKEKEDRPGMAGNLPAGLTAVRVSLEDAGCMVEDRYATPGISGGSVLAVGGVLQVTVQSVPVTADRDKKTQWFERTIAVQPGTGR
jgi:hypothetical protein